MPGTPMIVVLCVCVLTPNMIRPPLRPLGRRHQGELEDLVGAVVDFACGNFALIAGIVAPMPTPRAFAPPVIVIVVTLRGFESV